MSRVKAFDASLDLMKSLLWEHDKAEKLVMLTQFKQDWYNREHTTFWTNWVRDVFDISTANDFGLTLWGRILNVQLGITRPPTTGIPKWGFGVHNRNFTNGNFGRKVSGELGLSIEQKRLIIRLRYFQLTCRPTVPEINEFLATLFGPGAVWVGDTYDMEFATFIFKQAPDSQLVLILENFDLLPRPSAVGVRWLVQPRPAFGFGPNHLNFENGNFGA